MNNLSCVDTYKPLWGLTRSELKELLLKKGVLKTFVADQIFDWVYKKRIFDPNRMTNISLKDRQTISECFDFTYSEPIVSLRSVDGTEKFLFQFQGARVETVLMPHKGRWTLCVSSQAGCAMGCAFCKTATLKLKRNLSVSEMIQQVLFCYVHLAQVGERINNIVFMGMGEPFHNYDNLKKTLYILTDPKGFNFSWRQITVSTVGLVNRIQQFFDEHLPAQLAISLNAPTQDKRSKIMPVAKRFSVDELLSVIKSARLRPRQKIFIEYVLLDGFNTSPSDLRALVKLLHPVKERIKINLIPFNPFQGTAFTRPSESVVETWRSELVSRGFTATVRWSKGTDIQGGCGQLAATV